MNKLEEAAELLENNWCRGNLHIATDDGDKFCAVGALAAVKGYYEVFSRGDNVDEYTWVDDSIEAHALAETIKKTDWFKDQDEVDKSFYNKDTHPINLIVDFNDEQPTNAPVIEVFKLAAKDIPQVLDTEK